eukprot:1191099-Prorocentrum_minimum.AAC.6
MQQSTSPASFSSEYPITSDRNLGLYGKGKTTRDVLFPEMVNSLAFWSTHQIFGVWVEPRDHIELQRAKELYNAGQPGLHQGGLHELVGLVSKQKRSPHPRSTAKPEPSADDTDGPSGTTYVSLTKSLAHVSPLDWLEYTRVVLEYPRVAIRFVRTNTWNRSIRKTYKRDSCTTRLGRMTSSGLLSGIYAGAPRIAPSPAKGEHPKTARGGSRRRNRGQRAG